MSSDTVREVDNHSRSPAALTCEDREQQLMLFAQQAVALQGMARDQVRLQRLCDEHSMFAEAEDARRDMMQLLRATGSSSTGAPLCRGAGPLVSRAVDS